MKRADIKIGFACNNLCKFCVQGDKRDRYGSKTKKQVQKELTNAKKNGCLGVVFTGGEPTLVKDLVSLVAFAKKIGFKLIQIQSNGRMFAYRKFCESLIKAGVNEFSPALHGYTAELHDYLTGSTGSFEQVVLGIKNLKSLGQPVIINSVVTRSNYRHLPELAHLLVSLKVDQYQFAFVHALGTAGKNFYSVVPRKSLIEPYIKKGLDVGIKAGLRVMTEAIPYCFMDGYEEYIAEKIIPHGPIYDWDTVIDDFYVARTTSGKSKGKFCKKCKANNICEGPWKEYPEHYGWDEFKPIQ